MFRKRLQIIFRFFKFLRPYRRRWAVVLVLSQTAAMISLINPFLAKFAVDNAIVKKDLRFFLITVCIGASVFLFNSGINIAKDLIDRRIRIKVNFDLTKYLFTHMQRLSLRWFKDRSTGEHIYKIDNDVSAISDFICGTAPQVLMIFPKFLFIWAILCFLSPPIALFSLCLVPLYCFPPYYFARKMEKVFSEIAEYSEGLLEKLEENFSHIHLIKVFGKEQESRRGYMAGLINVIRLRIKNANFEIFSNFIMEMAGKIVVGLMTLYGGYLVIKGSLTLGGLTAIMAYFYQLVELQGQFGSFFDVISSGRVSCQRVADILDEVPEIADMPGARDIIFEKGEIVFKAITFGYSAQTLVLKNLEFMIKAGAHVALAGPSGCGKTTILNLIARLYDPQKGSILIDGCDIKNIKLLSLKKQIGFALQEPWLWNDTIENNIRYGNFKASKEQIIQAAEISGVGDFVKDFSKGYDSIIGEQASKISEGQKQKIAIARALIKSPKILILDEAMSMMDSLSEGKILANIKKCYSGITIITVSHRLSTVMTVDEVCYLAKSDAIFKGSAKDLFDNNASFAQLFSGQDNLLNK